eukprot:CAMPEP_0113490582 /NCGR_PEP_ID=MMETSP0014_2-20120614/27121_1 /TAXON_ID=2857 /ORGANISM="Nitzschia sp." /LENGTH=72 /DNA_ID=CAMNT_0000384359 /DNA_START=295 /DNA_END=513 /DNA_ORIENTATION=- /assembly_acc=CAM_ASM_000159
MTVLAPRSNNISTNRDPTKPQLPVTKALQPFGVSYPGFDGGPDDDIFVEELLLLLEDKNDNILFVMLILLSL